MMHLGKAWNGERVVPDALRIAAEARSASSRLAAQISCGVHEAFIGRS
jgi:hypothetical protein